MKYYIACVVWIDKYRDNDTRFEILLKLILIKYYDNLINWDINLIKQVEKTYDEISWDIQYQKQELIGKILDESQIKQF